MYKQYAYKRKTTTTTNSATPSSPPSEQLPATRPTLGAGNLPPPLWPPDRGGDSTAALPPSGHRPAKTSLPRLPSVRHHGGRTMDCQTTVSPCVCVCMRAYAVPLRVFPTEIVFTFPSRTETPCPPSRHPAEAGTRLFSVLPLSDRRTRRPQWLLLYRWSFTTGIARLLWTQ